MRRLKNRLRCQKSYIVAHRLGINIKHIVFDVMLASYIIDPSRTIDDVNSVVANYGQHYVQSSVAIYGKGKKNKFHQMTY